jgi:hypothetical protein
MAHRTIIVIGASAGGLSCPACGGVMWQTQETAIAQFLCHVGHSFEGEGLLANQTEVIEQHSWSLARALRTKATQRAKPGIPRWPTRRNRTSAWSEQSLLRG